MSEESKSSQPSLTEISHLFLTGLRDRQTEGIPRPLRKPPAATFTERPRPGVSIDLTPEEFAAQSHAATEPPPAVEFSVVLAHHFQTVALQRVREYARQAAMACGRVGLIELGNDGVRLTCFDSSPDSLGETAQAAPLEALDGNRIRQTIEELNWDIQRWLLFLPSGPTCPRSRQLLSQSRHWTLLSTADDAGIVAAYRALKGVAEVTNPAITLAVLNAEDQAHQTIIHRKLSGAAKQFLNRAIEQSPLPRAGQVAEHVVLWCRCAAGSAEQDHWTAVRQLAVSSDAPRSQPEPPPPEARPAITHPIAQPPSAPRRSPQPSPRPMRITPMETIAEPAVAEQPQPAFNAGDVIDLPSSCDGPALLAMIIKQQSRWIACPVTPPMCASGTIAVDRQGRLSLLACGLDDLRSISRGFLWLQENRALLKMAIPQMNIDAAAMPRLTLFLDQADVVADQLTPILASEQVTIQAYRRLRWGQKTGLLLEATASLAA